MTLVVNYFYTTYFCDFGIEHFIKFVIHLLIEMIKYMPDMIFCTFFSGAHKCGLDRVKGQVKVVPDI